MTCGRCGVSTGRLLDLDTGGGPCHPELRDCIAAQSARLKQLTAALEFLASDRCPCCRRDEIARLALAPKVAGA